MNDVTQNTKLIESLITDAEKEAATIVANAEQQAKEKEAAAKQQCETIARETDQLITARQAELEKNSESSLTVDKKKIMLKTEEQLYKKVLDSVTEKLLKIRDNADYAQIVIGWITESIIGLNTDSVIISGGSRELELLTPQLLKQAETEFHKLEKRKVNLTVDRDNVLPDPGIICTDESKRLLYDNRLNSRIRKYQRQIRKIIAQKLFMDRKKR